MTKGVLESFLSTSAVIQPKHAETYFGAPQLTVAKVNVKVGDRVNKGMVMLEYDLSDLDLSVRQARLQYDSALLQKKELLNQQEKINDAVDILAGRVEDAVEVQVVEGLMPGEAMMRIFLSLSMFRHPLSIPCIGMIFLWTP